MTVQYGTYQYPHDRRPGVVTWFVVYCVFMALLYAACAVFGGIILANPEDFRDPETDPEILGAILLIMGVPLMLAFGIAPFLPRRKWVWVVDIVLICLGLTSACFWLTNIPLLIFWLKAETKTWFGFDPPAPPGGYYPPGYYPQQGYYPPTYPPTYPPAGPYGRQ